MTEASPALIEALAVHRQDGDRCEACRQPWPCKPRQDAPGHLRPKRGVPNWREAEEIVARHTEVDGHCTACGEEWMCWTRNEARAELDAHDARQPDWWS